MNTIEKELLKATRQRAKSKKETDQQYRKRVVRAVGKLSDRAFYKLSEKAQKWNNPAAKASNKNKNIPAFPKQSRPLVHNHLERISRKVLEEEPDIITEFVNGQYGIYALYSENNLYYVGLAKNLLSRLLWHLVDRHAGKWDRFSVYLTGSEYRKDLETLLIHIAWSHLDGCKNYGNFVISANLSREVKANFKRKKKEESVTLFGS
jgi:hypothetical protein